MQVQELVGIVPWNFIATICNLFIQVYLIKRFLFKPINEMLEKRKAKADAQIQDAVKAKDEALAVMKNYWGGMAELGADTFWELYNPKNPDESPYGGTIVNSYCHAWSCAPAYFLRRYYSEK